MIRLKIIKINEKIAEKIMKIFKKIEYIFVNIYFKIEYTFINCYLTQAGENISDAKKRLKNKLYKI